jgi:hypothetical protein
MLIESRTGCLLTGQNAYKERENAYLVEQDAYKVGEDAHEVDKIC